MQVWEVATSTPTPIFSYHGHAYAVTAVAWSPNGAHLASASSVSEKTVQVWDARTGTTILTYHDHTLSVRAIAWSPDGTRIASTSNDGTAHVWVAS